MQERIRLRLRLKCIDLVKDCLFYLSYICILFIYSILLAHATEHHDDRASLVLGSIDLCPATYGDLHREGFIELTFSQSFATSGLEPNDDIKEIRMISCLQDAV